MNRGRGRSVGGSADVRGAVLASVVAAPVMVGVIYATAGALGLAGPAATGLSTIHFRRVLGDGSVWQGLGWTVATGLAATGLAAASAISVAAMFRGTALADRMARAAALAALPIPHVVAAVGGVLVLGQSGLLSRLGATLGLLQAPADFPAIVQDRLGIGFVITLGWKEFPFLAAFAVSILATRGAALEEAARTLGAGPWDVLKRVTLPVLWRGLAPVMVATFLFVAGSYEGAALLGPGNPLPLPTATLERYADLDLARRGDAYVLTLIGLLLAMVAVAVFECLRSCFDPLES